MCTPQSIGARACPRKAPTACAQPCPLVNRSAEKAPPSSRAQLWGGVRSRRRWLRRGSSLGASSAAGRAVAPASAVVPPCRSAQAHQATSRTLLRERVRRVSPDWALPNRARVQRNGHLSTQTLKHSARDSRPDSHHSARARNTEPTHATTESLCLWPHGGHQCSLRPLPVPLSVSQSLNSQAMAHTPMAEKMPPTCVASALRPVVSRPSSGRR